MLFPGMTFEDDYARRFPSKHSGANFFTRRVYQRWRRGEINTDEAVELLRPRGRTDMQCGTRWPVTFGATLEIDPRGLADDTTVGIVGLHLVRMGGRFVFWKYETGPQSAIAGFEFPTPDE